MSNDNPLDPQVLEQLRQLEAERPGLMKELIRLFVADAPKQMRLIDGAYGRRDPELLRQSAHFLRSGSLALGLNDLAAFTKSDLRGDEELRRLLGECGCGHLLEIEAGDFAASPRAIAAELRQYVGMAA